MVALPAHICLRQSGAPLGPDWVVSIVTAAAHTGEREGATQWGCTETPKWKACVFVLDCINNSSGLSSRTGEIKVKGHCIQ
jgi:hypothetical protein